MRKTIVTLLAIILALSIIGIAGASPGDQFADLPTNHWAYDAVSKLAKAGIISGYDDKSFHGDRTLTRYEMAQIVANAITKEDKVSAENRAIIEKLAVEFAAELNNLGVRVSKLEAKTNFTITSETWFQWAADDPPAKQPRILGNDAWQARERLYFHADVNPNTVFDSRLQTAVQNFGQNATVSSDTNFDRFYFTTKNIFGMDKVLWGRQPILFGQGFLSWKTGLNDGVTLFKKLSNVVSFQGGAYVAGVEPAATTTFSGNSQEFQYTSLGFNLNPNLMINTTYFNNNEYQTASSSAYNYGYDKSHGLDASFVQTLGKYTLLGEYAKSTLNNPVGNFASSSPKAYSIGFTNGTNNPQYFYADQRFIVDYKKPHTDAFEVQYRSVEKGAIPSGFGSPWGTWNCSPLYVLANGKSPNAVDNTKGFYYVYENVIAKGIVLSLEYQDLKFRDSGAPLDKAYQVSFKVVF